MRRLYVTVQLFASVALSLPVLVEAQVKALPSTIERDASAWLRRAEPFGISGAIAIVRDTAVTLLEGYGTLNTQGGRIGPDTPFIIGSLSKQFTAVAILRSAADGRLSLADSVWKFFPDTPTPQRNVTVEQLLTHTGGFPYLEPHMFDAAPDRSALMRELLSLPLDFTPGARWSYSNPGYAILAGILERAEQRSFESYLAERIFKPAGMLHTGFLGSSFPNAPNGVQLGEDQGAMNTTLGADRAVGNGSVVSTVRDMAKWEVALRLNRVLDRTWTAALFAPRVAASGGAQYAYGWNVLPTPRKTTLVFHAGDLGPFNSEFRRYVDDGFTVIWLSNARLASGGTRSVVTRMIAGLVNATGVVMPPEVASSQITPAATLQGHYRLPSGDTLVVSQDRDRLIMSATGADAMLALAGGVQDTVGVALRVAQAFTAVAEGNESPMQSRLHPSLPATQAIASIRDFVRRMTDSIGAPVRFESVGAMPGPPGTATVWIRMRGARRSLFLGFGTVAERIMTFTSPTEYASPLTMLRAAGDDLRYVWFDPATSREVRAVFERGTLTLTVNGKQVSAQRL